MEYDEIFKIEIESKYAMHFSEYMKGKNGLPSTEVFSGTTHE
jgi:adenylyl- and sulfurtransferase ThiI